MTAIHPTNSIAGDRWHRGIHREQELAVVGDLNPTWRRLFVRERRVANRLERAIAATSNADTLPALAPPCAFETYN